MCSDADSTTASMQTAVFHGASVYNAAMVASDASILINTHLTADANGTSFFGFIANAGNPAGIVSEVRHFSPHFSPPGEPLPRLNY